MIYLNRNPAPMARRGVQKIVQLSTANASENKPSLAKIQTRRTSRRSSDGPAGGKIGTWIQVGTPANKAIAKCGRKMRRRR
jgi:hypothetical protein